MSKEAYLKEVAGKITYAAILVDEELTPEEIEETLLGFLEEVYEAGHDKGYEEGERANRPMYGTPECPDW